MATIPMGNFGDAIAAPSQMANIPQNDALGEAGQRVGQTLQSVALDMTAQEAKRGEERQRAQAALALAKTNNDLHTVQTDIARGVSDGTIKADDALAEFQARSGKIKDTNLGGYLPDQRMVMDGHLVGTAGALERNLGEVVVQRKQQETVSTIDAFGEQVSREAARVGPEWAAKKFGAMVDFSGAAAGMNESQAAKVKQAFSERVHAAFYEQAGTAALTQNDADALGGLVKKLQGPEGEPLDPKTRTAMTHQLFGWQQSILAQRARSLNAAADEERRRYNAAADIFNKGTDIALSGGYFSPEFITEMTTTAADTAMAPSVLNLISSQTQVAGFASRPADERASILERMRNERSTPGVGTDPMGDKVLTAATAMDSKLRAEAKDNPWEAAQRAGVIKDAPIMNPANPAEAVQVMSQRMKQIDLIEQWTGERVSPLQPREVESVGKMVRSLPMDQAATMLGQIGLTMQNSERVAQVAKQLHDKDGTLGLAMLYANAQTLQGRYTAELVLRGDQAIKDKTVTVDGMKETGWRASIAKAVRGVYSDREAEDAYVDATFKIAAAKYVQNGSADIPEALALATGGVIERNGSKIPLPYGMKEDDFEKRIDGITSDAFSGQVTDGKVLVGRTPMPLDSFVATVPKAALVHAGQGLYNVRAGTTFVTNTAGKRLVIKVNP